MPHDTPKHNPKRPKRPYWLEVMGGHEANIFLRSGRVLSAIIIGADKRGLEVESIFTATRDGAPDEDVPTVTPADQRYMMAFIPWRSIDLIVSEPHEMPEMQPENPEINTTD